MEIAVEMEFCVEVMLWGKLAIIWFFWLPPFFWGQKWSWGLWQTHFDRYPSRRLRYTWAKWPSVEEINREQVEEKTRRLYPDVRLLIS
jgi:hypothetical protein